MDTENTEVLEAEFWTGDDANLQPILDYCDRIISAHRSEGNVQAWPAATALEAFQSQAKPGKDMKVQAFYSTLRLHGVAGQLGQYMMLAQRSHDRLKRVHDREIPDPQYEKLMRNRNTFNINRLHDFCVQEHARLNIILKEFRYGMRITLRREAVIRFRRHRLKKLAA